MTKSANADPPSPQVFEASLRSDGSVAMGEELTEAQAITIRSKGGEIVVCGDDLAANSDLAKRIEQKANGSYIRHGSHRTNGLPHYQPDPRPPEGHCFYETKNSKASKK